MSVSANPLLLDLHDAESEKMRELVPEEIMDVSGGKMTCTNTKTTDGEYDSCCKTGDPASMGDSWSGGGA